MKQSRKDFIKSAHKEACSMWKSKIEWEFPELFVKEGFEAGDWVTNGNGQTLFIYDKSGERIGFTSSRDWSTRIGTAYDHQIKKADPKEVEKALITEALGRGFKKGVRIKELLGLNVGTVSGDNYTLPSPDLEITDSLEYVYSGNLIIYMKGQWAEIIEEVKEMTLEEVEDKLGHKVKITS